MIETTSSIIVLIILITVKKCECNSKRNEIGYYGYHEENYYDERLPKVFLLVFVYILLVTIINKIISYFSVGLAETKITLLFAAVSCTLIYYFSGGNMYYISNINPRTTLTIILPVYYFKTTFSTDISVFTKYIIQILILSTVGTIMFGVVLGIVIGSLANLLIHTGAMLIFGFAMSFNILPFSTQAYKELTAMKTIITILDAESLIGTIVGILAFNVALGVQQQFLTVWYHYLLVISRSLIGAAIFGCCHGQLASWIILSFYNQISISFGITISSVYFTYYCCEYMLGFSAPLATFIVSLYFTLNIDEMPIPIYINLKELWAWVYNIIHALVFLQVIVTTIVHMIPNFNIHTFFQYVATYFIGTIIRMVVLILMSPVLIHTMNFKSFIASLWLSRKGVYNLILIQEAYHNESSHYAISQCLGHAFFVFGCSIIINDIFNPTLLSALELTKPNKARSSNMNNCLFFLETQFSSFIETMKLNRSTTDARWRVLDNIVLTHPYKQKQMDDNEQDNYKLWQMRKSYCTDCHRYISIEPNRKELKLMMTEARIRILRAQRVSFVRQCEKGFIAKESISNLLQDMDKAIDAQHYKLKTEDLVNIFEKKNWIDKFKKFLLALNKNNSKLKSPRKRFRKFCYNIVQHKAYDAFIYLVIICMFINYYFVYTTLIQLLLVTLMYSIFVLDFFLKLLSYSRIYIKDGLRIYFQSDWNKFDFLLLVIGLADIILDVYFRLSPAIRVEYRLLLITYEQLQNLRILKLVVILYAMVDRFAVICDRQIGKRLVVAYDIAQALLFSYDDIIHMLPQLIENHIILRIIENEMIVSRELILHEICMTHENMNWVSVTVKTKQMVRASTSNMKDSIKRLSLSGYIDDEELEKLHDQIDAYAKPVLQMKSIASASPEMIFYEQAWLYDYEEIDELYKNASLLNWEAGEVICKEGQMPPGIYIIVSGVAILSYVPNKNILGALYKHGQLPVKDYINNTDYELPQTECIFSGNSLGHLSILTSRPYNCNITCKTTVKAFLISVPDMMEAIEKSAHLYDTMWKFVSVDFASAIIWNTITYRGYSKEDIFAIVEKAYVPKLTNTTYKVCNEIADIFLVEGVVIDRNLGTKYIAPCNIHRYATKLKLNTEGSNQPVILVIPTKYKDHDIMDLMHTKTYNENRRIINENNTPLNLDSVIHVSFTKDDLHDDKENDKTTP